MHESQWGLGALLRRVALVGVGAALTLGTSGAAAQVRIHIVLQEGDVPAGATDTVANLDNPFVNGQGQMGFTGSFSTSGTFVFRNDQIVFREADFPTLNFGWTTVDSMGIGATDQWLFSPLIDNNNDLGIWTQLGEFIREGDPAPTYSAPATVGSIGNTLMDDTGGVFFRALIDLDGDTFSDEEVLFYAPDGTPASLTRLLEPGQDLGSGVVLGARTIDNDANLSNDGSHYIIRVQPSSLTRSVVVDGAVVMKRGDSDGVEGTWDNFDMFSVNNAGDYLVSGDTNAPSIRDEFIVHNGTIAVREEDVLDGVPLLNPATVQSLSINDEGHAAFAIRHNPGGVRSIFFACNAADIPGTAKLVMQEGDAVDIDGDGVEDATFDRFFPTNERIWLHATNDFHIATQIELEYPAGTVEAAIRIPVSCCGDNIVDSNEDCDDGVETSSCNVNCTTSMCGDTVVNASDGETCDDNGESAACNDDCTDAACGDGKLNILAGESCDDNGESAACNLDCSTAGCGDSKVNASAGEDCDEAGVESAICDDDCTIPICGDGHANTLAGETCDDGGESATCNADCTTANCGDGLVNTSANEDCDDGGVATAGCNDDCSYSACGDGVPNAAAGEQCDDSGESATCNTDCTTSACGDGILNTSAGEQCEDGNQLGNDGCSANCEFEAGSGSGGSGGIAAGGATTGGATSGGSGGTSAGGGEAGSAGAGGSAAGATSSPASSTDDGGCGCRLPGGSGDNSPAPAGLLIGLGLLGAALRRRQPTRRG